MSSIKTYARRLEIFSKILMVLVLIGLVLKWIQDNIPYGEGIDLLVNYHANFDGKTFVECLNAMPALHRLLGLLVDGVSVIIFIVGLRSFIRLMRLFQRGEIFSSTTLSLLHKITQYALAWAIYSPIKDSLLSVVTTLHNPPGQRMLTISFGFHDLINIFIFGIFVVIASIMNEGSKLKQEQDFTV